MRSAGFARHWLGAGVLVAIAAMAGALRGEEKRMTSAPGKDSAAWTARNEKINARVGRGNVELIFVGDSAAQGWENKGKKAWAKFYEKRQAVNLGIAGDRAENIVWRLDHGNVEGIEPKAAVVMMGTDYGKDATAEEIAAGVKTVMEKLRAKLPKTPVLIVGILPRGANNEDARRKEDVKANETIAKLADGKTVFFHDIGYVFVDGEGKPLKKLRPDGEHLSAAGYETLAEWLEAMVTSVRKGMEDAVLPTPLSIHKWWFQVYRGLNARVKQGNVDMIFLGDSLTNGWVNEGRTTWAKYYAKRNAVNLGISSERTQNVLWRLDNGNIDGIAPKLAVVLIGANNAAGRSTVEDTAAGVKAVIERVRKNSPKTKVLLLGLMPRGETSQEQWWQLNLKVNAIISKFADGKKVFYLDMGPKFATEDGKLRKELYKPDATHFTEKGYATWAETMEPMVAKLMGEGK